MEVRELPIDEIVLDPTLNLRDRLDEETVERYAESWEDLPPVAVFEVDGQWLLADGFHRHAAYVARERPKIPAQVHAGGFDEALAFAALANLKHGLPLRRQERRRVVEVRLRMAPESSDRQLARELGVSRDLVARVRSDLVGAGQIERVEGRVGADGKVYPSQGLPRDPNEGLPKSSPPPPREPRSKRDDDFDDRSPPWDDTGAEPVAAAPEFGPMPNFPAVDAKTLAKNGPVPVSTPTIDEMLELMARQIMEVVCWVEGDEFADAYRRGGEKACSRFRTAVRVLAEAADALDGR